MDPLLIPLAALAIPIIVVPTALAFKHAAKLREYVHAERMRALELGQISPADERAAQLREYAHAESLREQELGRLNAADESRSINGRIGAGIGAGVPIVAMVSAMVATLETGFHEEIWMFSGMVGIAAVICGTVLAAGARSAKADGAADVKPVYEPDAFDVVGTRG